MEVGDLFSSYEDLEKALSLYKANVHNEYWIRDARTLINQRKRFPETVNHCNESLKYYHIRFACVKGGRPFQTKNDKSTRKCSTLKQDCQASIFLRLSKCQKYLTVIEIKDKHNHSSSKTNFTSLSQRRLQLPKPMRDKTKRLDEALCLKRWTSKSKTNLPKSLTNHQKFSIMNKKCKTMAKLCSEVSTPLFLERLDLIQNIITFWTEGKDLLLNEQINSLIANENMDRSIETPTERTVSEQSVEIPTKCIVTVDVQTLQSDLNEMGTLSNENDPKTFQEITQMEIKNEQRTEPLDLNEMGTLSNENDLKTFQEITQMENKNEQRTEPLKNFVEGFITQHTADNIKEIQHSREEENKENSKMQIVDQIEDYIKEEYLEEDYKTIIKEEYFEEEYLEQEFEKDLPL